MSYAFQHNAPGFTSEKYTNESAPFQVLRGGYAMESDRYYQIDSTAVDAGNTPTTTLRRGIGMIEQASGLLVPFGQASKTGKIVGVLSDTVDMLQDGVATQRTVPLITSARMSATQIPNLTEELAAGLLANGFQFVEQNYKQLDGAYVETVILAANATLTAADSKKLFVVTAAAALTLPAPKAGYVFTVLSTSGNTVTAASSGNFLTGGTVTFNSAGEAAVIRAVKTAATPTYKYVVEILYGTPTVS